MKVLLIGAGAVGSYHADYLAKLSKTQNIPLELFVADFDPVEERNTYSQNFSPQDIGRLKCDVVSEKAKLYIPEVVPINLKVDTANILELNEKYGPFDLVSITVDNQPSRITLSNTVVHVLKIPVLHTSINLLGSGQSTWCYLSEATGQYRTSWPEDPAVITHEQLTKFLSPPEKDLLSPPPCELVGFISLIQTAALEAAMNIIIYGGTDIHKEVQAFLYKNELLPKEQIEKLPTSTKGFMLSKVMSYSNAQSISLFNING